MGAVILPRFTVSPLGLLAAERTVVGSLQAPAPGFPDRSAVQGRSAARKDSVVRLVEPAACPGAAPSMAAAAPAASAASSDSASRRWAESLPAAGPVAAQSRRRPGPAEASASASADDWRTETGVIRSTDRPVTHRQNHDLVKDGCSGHADIPLRRDVSACGAKNEIEHLALRAIDELERHRGTAQLVGVHDDGLTDAGPFIENLAQRHVLSDERSPAIAQRQFQVASRGQRRASRNQHCGKCQSSENCAWDGSPPGFNYTAR